MTDFHKDDRVRFKPHIGERLTRKGRKHFTDWKNRIGTVSSEPMWKTSGGIDVIWDGNRSPIREPRNALEIIPK